MVPRGFSLPTGTLPLPRDSSSLGELIAHGMPTDFPPLNEAIGLPRTHRCAHLEGRCAWFVLLDSRGGLDHASQPGSKP